MGHAFHSEALAQFSHTPSHEFHFIHSFERETHHHRRQIHRRPHQHLSLSKHRAAETQLSFHHLNFHHHQFQSRRRRSALSQSPSIYHQTPCHASETSRSQKRPRRHHRHFFFRYGLEKRRRPVCFRSHILRFRKDCFHQSHAC